MKPKHGLEPHLLTTAISLVIGVVLFAYNMNEVANDGMNLTLEDPDGILKWYLRAMLLSSIVPLVITDLIFRDSHFKYFFSFLHYLLVFLLATFLVSDLLQ